MPNDCNGSVLCLHGDLNLKIMEARRLPNMDIVTERIRRFFNACDACTKPPKSKRTQSTRHIITSDPYVTICLAGATVARTRVIPNSQHPTWNEHFNIPLAHSVTHIEFHVKDDNLFGADMIGTATLPVERISYGQTVSEWLPIINFYGKPPKLDCALRMELTFRPCKENLFYNNGIPKCYFPVRHGGAVTLYQDCHRHSKRRSEKEKQER